MSTIELTAENFNDTVSAEGITFVDWWADWCMPCRAFAPTYDKASEKHTDVRFGKVDTEDQQGLSAAAEISAIPTLMAFRDGILVFRQAGALRPKDLEEVIDAVKALDMDDVRRQVAEAQAEAPSQTAASA